MSLWVSWTWLLILAEHTYVCSLLWIGRQPRWPLLGPITCLRVGWPYTGLGWVKLEWLNLSSLVSHIPLVGKPGLILIVAGHGWDLEPQNWHIATLVPFFWANWVTTPTQIWVVGNITTAGWEKLQNHIAKCMDTGRGKEWGHFCI